VTPLPAYTSVCKFCHWYTFCVEQLTAAGDLTLIPYLGRDLRDAMQDTVANVAELAASNPEAFMVGKKTIFPGLGKDRLRLFHSRAVMLSQATPKPYLRAPIALRLSPMEIFFDVEVDPLRAEYRAGGLAHQATRPGS
jgi:predicted RecB family nuclease